MQLVQHSSCSSSAMDGQLQFLCAVVDIIQDFLLSSQDRTSKVVEFKSPDELLGLIDITLKQEGASDQEVLELCRKALQYSVHTAHPRMFNTLFSGVDVTGLSGVALAAATNTNMYTYEMAPVFSLMEKEVLQKMCELIGWSHGSGIFAPGGSVSNLYGLLAARYRLFPDTKEKGCTHLPQFTIFSSCQAHYSVEKGSIILGIGTDNVVKIKCDQMGRMDTADLERAVQETIARGHIPLVVVGTAGTTVLGAFDPLEKIADVCATHNVWFHVDGSYGGSCLMSATHRHLCRGLERADSVVWNPHKSLHVPLQCSAFLTRHDIIQQNMLSLHASYLFQKDKVLYDPSFDTGDTSLQCSRLNDALKLWLMWKRNGLAWFGKLVDHQMRLATYLRSRIRERTGFQLVIEEQQYTNVSFWYTPPCLRQCGDEAERKQRLHRVAPQLKAAMVLNGTMMISYQPLEGLPNFFRMVTVSPSADEADMDFVLDELDRLGAGLVV